MKQNENLFDLSGRVAIITGGAGLLGRRHARALADAGAVPVLIDLEEKALQSAVDDLGLSADSSLVVQADITNEGQVESALKKIVARFGRIDILINNAASNPKMDGKDRHLSSRLEKFSLEQWNGELAVGITGTFLCSKTFGSWMAEQGNGVILNIASDLSVIAPDQRLYRVEGLDPNQQPVKPVTYSVVKAAVVGMTRYLATYWAEKGVRCNALSPGGVYNGQPSEFVQRVSDLIPMGRMARVDEYEGAVLFLCSDASSYMTGQNLIVDGGRSCW
jgi:NAD(P)-dependent dehydrogenase (short-subunit alcohol dehydrogenase family)